MWLLSNIQIELQAKIRITEFNTLGFVNYLSVSDQSEARVANVHRVHNVRLFINAQQAQSSAALNILGLKNLNRLACKFGHLVRVEVIVSDYVDTVAKQTSRKYLWIYAY